MDNDQWVSEWSGRYHALGTREIAVIDVANGLNVEVYPGEHGHKREYGHGVAYKSPLDTFPSAISRVQQRGHTFEGDHDDDTWNIPNRRNEHG